MADEKEHAGSPVEDEPSLLEKIGDKIHVGDHDSSSSSSSDSDNEKSEKKTESVKAKVFRIFGRERPVHHVLGGGKCTDI